MIYNWLLLHDKEIDSRLNKYLEERKDISIFYDLNSFHGSLVTNGYSGIARTNINNFYDSTILWPGPFCNPKHFKVSHWARFFGEDYINYGAMFTTGGLFQVKNLYDSFHIFVRPNSGMKPFDGKVETVTYWKNFFSDMDFKEEFVLVNINPCPFIVKEVRCLAVGDQIITGTSYIGKRVTYEEIRKCSTILKNRYHFDLFNDNNYPYIIDFAFSYYGGCQVLELNSVGLSGLYDMNLEIFVDTLHNCYTKLV